VLTVAEVMATVKDSAWRELNANADGKFTAREPMVSSLRRNLQREHLERLIDLSMAADGFNAVEMPVKTMAVAQLRELQAKLEDRVKSASKMDPYTAAHFGECAVRIDKALDAAYIYNASDIGGGVISLPLFGREGKSE
jgi:hypothetical protein